MHIYSIYFPWQCLVLWCIIHQKQQSTVHYSKWLDVIKSCIQHMAIKGCIWGNREMLLYIYIVRLLKHPSTNEKTNTVISLTDGQNTDGTIQNNSHPTTNNKPASGQFKKPHKNNNSSADGRRTKFLIKTTFAEKKGRKGSVFLLLLLFVILFQRHRKGLIPQTLWKYLWDGYKDAGDLWGILTASCQIFPHPSFRKAREIFISPRHAPFNWNPIAFQFDCGWRSSGKKKKKKNTDEGENKWVFDSLCKLWRKDGTVVLYCTTFGSPIFFHFSPINLFRPSLQQKMAFHHPQLLSKSLLLQTKSLKMTNRFCWPTSRPPNRGRFTSTPGIWIPTWPPWPDPSMTAAPENSSACPPALARST